MIRTFPIVILVMMFTATFGQAQQEADGLYHDKSGKLFTGTCVEYHPDSVIRATIEVKNGKLDGTTKIYFNDGQLEEIRSFKKGMMHGKWEKWNHENIKIAEAGYMDDKKDGKWYVWDDNGTLRYDMTYQNGEKKGTWLMYDEQGKLISQKEY